MIATAQLLCVVVGASAFALGAVEVCYDHHRRAALWFLGCAICLLAAALL